jgi:hypothetical protein
MVEIETEGFLRGGYGCPETIKLPFIAGTAPSETASCSEDFSGGIKRGMKWFKGLFE